MKKTTKLISILLVLAMLLSMAPLSLTAFAATPTPYDGVPVTPQKISSSNYAKLGLTDSNWSQFDGYYAIRNAKELYGFADIVNGQYNTYGFNGVLLQDIVVNANGGTTYDWIPLNDRTNSNSYEGIFDGNGHYISGLYSTTALTSAGRTDKFCGFTFKLKGTVKNLTIKNSTFAPGMDIGAYGGIGVITAYPVGCTIENCRVENVTVKAISSNGQLGGIAGYGGGQNSTIKNCVSINVTFSGGGTTNAISNYAPYTNCYTSSGATHTCANISVEHKEVKATCEYPGLSNYKYCLVCGNVTSGTKTETPATGHTWKPATCQAPKTCSACGLTEGSVESHKYTTYTLSTNAMCGSNAKETAFCDYGCGGTDTREISGTALAHSYTYSASGNTITAVCANGVNCPDPEGTLTISAPADLYADGTTAKEATVENNLVDTSVAVNVTYSTADGSAPKTAGTYTASVTVGGATASVEFELVKRSAAAENFVYIAPENLVYDGTAKYAAVEVSPEITGMGAITVTYYKDGEAVEPINAGTYTVKVSTADSDKYYAINDVELASFTITAKDISDGFIILGEALTYNGKEQTQTVEKVIPTGTAPEATFTVSGNKATNVGVYLLTVTGTGNFTGEAKIAFEIAVDVSGLDYSEADGYYWSDVKSTDKDRIEYVYNQIRNASTEYADEDKKAEWNTLLNNCNEMLLMIKSVTDHLESFKEEVAGYDIDTVTSDDYDYLEGLYESEGQWLYDHGENYTDEEIKEFSDTLDDLQKLKIRISDVANEITRIETAINGYGNATVKSSDKADIEQLKVNIKALADGQNITAEERAKLENLDATADALLAKIAETAAEYDRVIAAANGYDEATVTSADKDALVQLNDDIYALALTDNVTAEEKENLQAAHNKVIGLIDKLTAISDEIKRIIEAVDKYVFESVKSSDKADIEQLIADIKALLDTQNITSDERTLLEIADETCTKLIEKVDETVAEINRINDATNAYDIDTVTSADKADIEKLIADIKALTDGDNITDDEREQLVANDETLDALLERINETVAEFERINTEVDSYNVDSVKSPDREAVEQLKEDIEALKATDNVTEEEKAVLEEKLEKVNGLIGRITQIEEQLEKIADIENEYNPETVSSDDKAAIEEAIAEIEAVNPDNLTDEQKAEYAEIKAGFEELLEEIAAAEKDVADIGVELEIFNEERVTIFWEDDIEVLKAKVDELLADENMGEAEKAKLNEYKAQAEKLIEIINTPKEYFSLRFFYLIWDCLTWKYNGILWLFKQIFAF